MVLIFSVAAVILIISVVHEEINKNFAYEVRMDVRNFITMKHPVLLNLLSPHYLAGPGVSGDRL